MFLGSVKILPDGLYSLGINARVSWCKDEYGIWRLVFADARSLK